VSPGNFKPMNIPRLHGREFTDADGPNSNPVMIGGEPWQRNPGLIPTLLAHTLLKDSVHCRSSGRRVRSTALNQEPPAFYFPLASRGWLHQDPPQIGNHCCGKTGAKIGPGAIFATPAGATAMVN
jgi:hypothetical protein